MRNAALAGVELGVHAIEIEREYTPDFMVIPTLLPRIRKLTIILILFNLFLVNSQLGFRRATRPLAACAALLIFLIGIRHYHSQHSY